MKMLIKSRLETNLSRILH